MARIFHWDILLSIREMDFLMTVLIVGLTLALKIAKGNYSREPMTWCAINNGFKEVPGRCWLSLLKIAVRNSVGNR